MWGMEAALQGDRAEPSVPGASLPLDMPAARHRHGHTEGEFV